MIKIEYRPGFMGWAVYEYRLGGNGYKEVRDSKGGWTVAKPNTAVEPTLVIEDLAEWAQAIRDAGVKLPSDHKLEGVLEAQSNHLEDMRRLVSARVAGAQRPAHKKTPSLLKERKL